MAQMPAAPKEPAFLYSDLLLSALAVPLLILLAFGGKPTLLVLAFGAIVSYIFDLLGSVEGTLMVALVTVLGVWASLVWAARVLLRQSLGNFIMLAVMGALLAFLYVLLAALFRSVRAEFETTLHFCETLVFATLPLLASCLVTWFVCVELPGLDAPTVLATSYFLYVLVLSSPRPSSGSAPHAPRMRRVLSPHLAAAIYALPVFLCPCVHAAFNHHALYRAAVGGHLGRLSGLAIAGLFPLLLMAQAALSHGYHIAPAAGNDGSSIAEATGASSASTATSRGTFNLVTSALQTTKVTAVSGLLLCLQSRPYFADLKRASGLAEPLASLLFVLIGALTAAGVWVSSGGRGATPKPWGSTDEDDDKRYAARHLGSMVGGGKGVAVTQSWGRKALVSVLSASVCALLAVALGLPRVLVGLCGVGGGLYSEYAQRWVGTGSWFVWLVGQGMSTLAGGVASLAALSLTAQSLYFLDVDFFWHDLEVPIRHVCLGFVSLVSSGVGISSLALQAKASAQATAFLPVSSSNLFAASNAAPSPSLPGNLFCSSYVAFLIFVSAFELFVREQEWDLWETTREDVYPSFLLGLTALVASMLSFHLYSKDLLGVPLLMACLATQAFKLLHVVAVPSQAIGASLGVFCAYALPFVTHRQSLLKERSSADEGAELVSQQAPSTPGPASVVTVTTGVGEPSALRLWMYFTLGVTVTAFARVHLLHAALAALLLRDVAPVQSSALAVALIAAFSAALLHAFRPAAALLRSLMLAAAGMGVLVCTDALGPVSVALDPTAPLYVSVNFGGESGPSDSGLYLLLSCALLLLAAGGVIPVRRPISRLLFVVGMTFCGGKALSGWCFPLSLNADSMHYGPTQIPALYGHIQMALATSAVLYAALPAKATGGGGSVGSSLAFVLQALVPLAFMMYASLLHEPEHHLGLMWGGVAVNGLVAFVVRCGEMNRQVEAVRRDDGSSNSTPILLQQMAGGGGARSGAQRGLADTGSSTVCVMAAGLGIAWCFAASLVTPHVDADTAVPLSFLLLLCTRRGAALGGDSHPVALAAVLAVAFWLGSTAYSVFVKNFGDQPEGFEPGLGLGSLYNMSIFRDEDVSIWTSTRRWVPWATCILAVLPLPAVALSFLRRKADTEDTVFVLAILSVVSVVGGMCWSVRYLGLAGLGYASYRCWEIGSISKSSNTLI